MSNMRRVRYCLNFTFVVFALVLISGKYADVYADKKEQSSFVERSIVDTGPTIEERIENGIREQVVAFRSSITDEVMSVVKNTKVALRSLDKEDIITAKKAIDNAKSNIDKIIESDKDIDFVPISITTVTKVMSMTPDEVEVLITKAKGLLARKNIPAAKSILNNLVSEIVITRTSIPVITYSNALKVAATLVEDRKLEDAKDVLQTALNTLSIKAEVIPIPVASAEKLLDDAKQLAEKDGRSSIENKQLENLLEAAEEEIKLAELLGYGTRLEFEIFRDEIAKIRDKTSNGKYGFDFFDRIFSSLKEMTKKSQRK